jgi:hypothetical protein
MENISVAIRVRGGDAIASVKDADTRRLLGDEHSKRYACKLQLSRMRINNQRPLQVAFTITHVACGALLCRQVGATSQLWMATR